MLHCGGVAMLLDKEMSSESCSSESGERTGAPRFGKLAIELLMESILF